jgi:hypothetical protein
VAGAYVRRAAYRRAESDSTPLDFGCRKSRAAGAQPRGAKSVTAWPFPLPRSAARLSGIGGQRRRRQRGNAYVRKAAYRRSGSDSAPLNVGGRKSRRAETQPRCAKSMKLSFFTSAERRCQAHRGWRPASSTSTWRCVRAKSSLLSGRKQLLHARYRWKEESRSRRSHEMRSR